MTEDALSEERWLAHRREHDAEERARLEAVLALKERLAGMNEFRDQLRDQAATFARLDVVDRLETQVEHRYEELRGLIATEREERRDQQNLRTGARQGISQTTGLILAGIGAVATVLAIASLLVNLIR